MKKWLLELKEITTKHGGSAVIDAEDMHEAVLQASDYFTQGLYHTGVKPNEVWYPHDQTHTVTEVTVRRECSPPGPYIVYWCFPGDPDELEATFDTYGVAEMLAEGIKATLPHSAGRVEYIESPEYEGNGDWAWTPSIQMQWGAE